MTKVSDFIRKNKFVIISGLIALFFAFCCFFVYLSVIKPTSENLNGEFVDDFYWDNPIDLNSSTVVKQTFIANKYISAISLVFFNTASAEGELTVKLYNAQTKELLASSTKSISELAHAQYSTFSFGKNLNCKNISLTLEITAHYTSGGPISLGCSTENILEDLPLVVNNQPQNGTVPLKVSLDNIESFSAKMFIIVAVLIVAFVSLLFFFSKLGSFPVHKLFLVAVIVIGLLYNFILPPYSSPDEMFHINQAFNNSSVFLGSVEKADVKLGENYKRPSDENALVQDKNTTAFTYREVFSNLFTISPDGALDTVKFDQEQVGGFNFLYILSSIGIVLARILGLGFVPALMLGRLFNFAFFVCMSYFAVKITPVAKSCFAVVALLPMTLHLAASFNRDSMLISIAIIFTAYCFRCAYDKSITTLKLKDIVVLGVIIMMLAPSKVIYLPLCLLFFIIPSSRFSSKKFAIYARIALACCMIIPYINSLSWAHSMYIITHGAESVPPGVEVHPDMIRYIVPYILTHLKEAIYITINTFVENTSFYLTSMVGSSLGYYSLAIDPLWVTGIFGVMALAVLDSSSNLRLKPKTMLAGIGIVIVIAALIVGGCLTWTPTYYTTIYGIQGRYFLPVLPLLLACFQTKHLQLNGDKSKAIIWSISAIQCFVLINIFLVIIAR